MQRIRPIEYGLLGLIILLIVGVYIHSRTVAASADAEHKANQVLQTQLESIRMDFEKQIADRDSQSKKELETIQQKFSEAAKSQAKAQALISKVANLPAPVVITTPAPTKENPKPAPVAVIPQPDFEPAVAYARECEICKSTLKATQLDLQDREKQAQIADQQIQQLKKDNTVLAKASKGGGFFVTLKHSAKWLGIGILTGVAVVCGSGHCK